MAFAPTNRKSVAKNASSLVTGLWTESGVGYLKPHLVEDVLKAWSRVSRPTVSSGRKSPRMMEHQHRRTLELSRHSGKGDCPDPALLPLKTGPVVNTTARTYASDPLIKGCLL